VNAGIATIAFALGSEVQTNEALGLLNPSWDMARTFERSGVASRPIAAAGETALDLGERAARAMFESAAVQANDIDALIFCTQSPDHVLPPNSTLLHGRLGMRQDVMAFDIVHACSGFVYGLGIARSLVVSGAARKVMLINADTYSRLVHPQDRSTRPIFGDGAAATLIVGVDPTLEVIDASFHTAGQHAGRFIVQAGGARQANEIEPPQIDPSGRVHSDAHIRMDGIGVLSFFTAVVPKAVRELLARHTLTIEDISLFVFHQASRLALDGLQRSLAISGDRMIVDIEHTGNLVSASIPVTLARALEAGRLLPGQWVVLSGFGVGLSWGTVLVRYLGLKP
jgi:3-oxoacyl-[acyl-carrier-protein] synthase-3